MASLDDFLSQNPHLHQDGTAPLREAAQDNPTIVAILLAAGPEWVSFAHLGKVFKVARDGVVDVVASDKAVPNPFGRGEVVALTLDAGAEIVMERRAKAADLFAKGIPFAIERPSQIDGITIPMHTEREVEWMAAHNVDIAPFTDAGSTATKSQVQSASGCNVTTTGKTSTTSGTYCGHNTTSPKWSGTTSGGRQDDGHSDEYYADDASHDDHGTDDSNTDSVSDFVADDDLTDTENDDSTSDQATA